MVRFLVLVCLVVALSACGFRPRASLALADELGPVRVQTADPYSPLAQGLSTALQRAGAQSAAEGQPAAVLRVSAERMTTRALAVDRQARVREYETRYRVVFDVLGADGKVLLKPQTIDLSREYTYDSFSPAGSPAEQELLQGELRREMTAAILRRLDAVLRAD